MVTRCFATQLGSAGLLAPALWLSSSEHEKHEPSYHALPHISFASAADVLRDADHNADVTEQ
jgi:hypothetical protein